MTGSLAHSSSQGMIVCPMVIPRRRPGCRGRHTGSGAIEGPGSVEHCNIRAGFRECVPGHVYDTGGDSSRGNALPSPARDGQQAPCVLWAAFPGKRGGPGGLPRLDRADAVLAQFKRHMVYWEPVPLQCEWVHV